MVLNIAKKLFCKVNDCDRDEYPPKNLQQPYDLKF